MAVPEAGSCPAAGGAEVISCLVPRVSVHLSAVAGFTLRVRHVILKGGPLSRPSPACLRASACHDCLLDLCFLSYVSAFSFLVQLQLLREASPA